MRGHRLRSPGKPLSRRQVLRAVLVTGSLAFLAFAVGVWTLVNVAVDGHRTVQDSNRKITALYESAAANRAKLVAVGEQPVGPPPDQILGKAGPPGATGPQGPAGRDGRDGRDATPAQVAAAVASYIAAHPPKPGPAGPAGRAGRDGTDGQSPACLAEPDECRGPAGPAGADGAAGPAGQPPSAWMWTDPQTKTTFECRRDASSPDSAPAYVCSAVT